MSGAAANSHDVPFCQQNTRLWVVLLAVSSVLVLGFAFYLAFEGGRFKGLSHRMSDADAPATAAAGAALAPAAPHLAPASPAAPPQVATPVAMVRPYQPGAAIAAAPAPGLTDEALRRVAQRAGPSVAQQLQTSFNSVADKIRPCVVNINAVRPSRRVVANQANNPRFIDPFDGVPEKIFGKVAYESVGSGVIIDGAGYVVTNDHLVDGALSIVVTRFNSNEHVPAALVATDRGSDLALLKLQGDGPFPAAELANSDRVEVGDWVLAVGNPFGLGHTVTAGIVSSRRSAIVISGVQYKDLLQTDAPINQGSSGGPLVDLNGKVVGINTAIYAPTGVFNGTGFAIPANRVGAFVARTMGQAQRGLGGLASPAIAPPAAGGGILNVAGNGQPRPWLGVGVSEMTPLLASKLGLPQPTGVFVNSVEQGSPAAESELQRGDVIVGIAGQPVNDSRSLQGVLSALPAGLRVPVVVWRRGRARTKNVRLKAQPAVANNARW